MLKNETYYYQVFGNIVLDYHKDLVLLRVTRDRLQWFCELSLPDVPGAEFDTLVLLKAIGKQSQIDGLIRDR